ncbi:MAG: hypothetical protein F6K36_29745 [Symploca sp. SIO3C6]|nr:hypothetical protein [Symploca sp. SIO3C6]
MLPTITHASTITCFAYWDCGIKQGMRYFNELYTHSRSFARKDREQAYLLGTKLAESGAKVCLTVSEDAYSIWLELRSCAAASA